VTYVSFARQSHVANAIVLWFNQKIGKFGKGVVSSLISEAELK
jgi:uncharacterized protein YwbE